MENKMEKTMVQLLVEELICKSCSAQMTPPLFQCFFGHNECSRCYEISQKCSVCSITRKSRRNCFLERLCFGTILKCSFANEGCVFSDKALGVAAHEKICTFGTNTNPSSKFENNDCEKTVEESQFNQRADRVKDSPGKFLKDVTASALECPVCFTRILPPIHECHNGHQICFECFSRTRACPVCRCPKIIQFNKFLGQIFERLEVPCKYAIDGCQIRRKGRSILSHELSCEFHQAIL